MTCTLRAQVTAINKKDAAGFMDKTPSIPRRLCIIYELTSYYFRIIPMAVKGPPGIPPPFFYFIFPAAFTTTPLRARRARIFGITISPLKKSASDHTSSSFRAEPTIMQITTIKE